MTVVPLPIWKEGATPEEYFAELSHYARQSPQRFSKVIVVMVEDKQHGGREIRTSWSGTLTLFEQLGILEAGKSHTLREAGG